MRLVVAVLLLLAVGSAYGLDFPMYPSPGDPFRISSSIIEEAQIDQPMLVRVGAYNTWGAPMTFTIGVAECGPGELPEVVSFPGRLEPEAMGAWTVQLRFAGEPRQVLCNLTLSGDGVILDSTTLLVRLSQEGRYGVPIPDEEWFRQVQQPTAASVDASMEDLFGPPKRGPTPVHLGVALAVLVLGALIAVGLRHRR